MSISNRLFTRSHLGRITFSALIALSVNLPAMAQVVPITLGAPAVQGTLVSTDLGPLPDGRPYDVYTFTAPPGQVFSIIAGSPDVPLSSTLFINDPAGPIPVSTTFVYAPDILEYAYGGRPQATNFAFRILSADLQQPTGPSDTARYSVALSDLGVISPAAKRARGLLGRSRP